MEDGTAMLGLMTTTDDSILDEKDVFGLEDEVEEAPTQYYWNKGMKESGFRVTGTEPNRYAGSKPQVTRIVSHGEHSLSKKNILSKFTHLCQLCGMLLRNKDHRKCPGKIPLYNEGLPDYVTTNQLFCGICRTQLSPSEYLYHTSSCSSLLPSTSFGSLKCPHCPYKSTLPNCYKIHVSKHAASRRLKKAKS